MNYKLAKLHIDWTMFTMVQPNFIKDLISLDSIFVDNSKSNGFPTCFTPPTMFRFLKVKIFYVSCIFRLNIRVFLSLQHTINALTHNNFFRLTISYLNIGKFRKLKCREFKSPNTTLLNQTFIQYHTTLVLD